jgi:tetratricopeptide (TPR) repeat protein
MVILANAKGLDMRQVVQVFVLFVMLVTSVWSMDVASYISKAQKAQENKRYDTAIKWFRKALSIIKDRHTKTKILFQMGDCYYLLHNCLAAFALYQEALKDPRAKDYLISHPKTYLNLANIYFDRGNYKRAAEIYLQVAQRYKNKSFASFALVKGADSFLNMKNYKKALEIYSKVVLLYKDTNEYWISKFRMADIGVSHPGIDVPQDIEYRAYFKPEDAYKEIISSAPDDLLKLKQLAELRIASLYLKKGESSKSIALISSFIKENPFSAFQDYAKGLLRKAVEKRISELYHKKAYEKICTLYESVKRHVPVSSLTSRAVEILAEAKYKTGAYKEALRLYMTDPASHLLQIASIYNLLGRYKETISLLMPLRNKLSSELILVLARALYKEKRFADVIKLFKDVTDLSPEACYLLANSCYHLNHLKEAVQYYSLIIRGNSEYRLNALISVANIFFSQKQFKKALRYYKKAQTLCKNCPDADFIKLQIANCYYCLGDQSSSASILKSLKKADTLIRWAANTQLELMQLENRYKELKWLIE